MNKKKIIIIISLLLIVVFGTYYFIIRKANERPVVEVDEATKEMVIPLFQDIKQETGIAFEDSYGLEFEWQYENESGEYKAELLKGLAMEVRVIDPEKAQDVKNYFMRKALFEVDPYNQGIGTVYSLNGYYKDEVVCIFSTLVTNFDPDSGKMPESMQYRDFQVRCALYN